ncbi:Carbohydrate acetyl esterase/feruloyl esterase precursor [Rubripirellula amarantea]|uniref:Carbohydrate acetyl esterase/feruloyl esterase n=2 Tax=Rubripirellula amarantea TaxID=2527999 RepID=A0A5C5WWP0_9BACT|nr:Carbohydrate acetyl esterase/feruloyl esterase precursor [Rubripirellula amarantea]
MPIVANAQYRSNVGNPTVHADKSATFHFDGGNAQTVELVLVNETYAMENQGEGKWSFTSDPLPPGIHDYIFRVDGAEVTDKKNRWVKTWISSRNQFEVPGDTPLVTEEQAVPHGVLHSHYYRSKAAGYQRKAIVYTPPGYDPKRDQPYPLLVLCHGYGDDESAWTVTGRAHLITDNLIAAGKIEPLVIVMPHGHPEPLESKDWSDDYASRNLEKMTSDILGDLLPMVESNYLVAETAERRAIAGLSMGGGHSISTGLANPHVFAWVGAFSAAIPLDSWWDDNEIDILGDNAQQRKLFWIACGRDDFLYDKNVQFDAKLNEKGISHQFVQTEGAHNWYVWRDYLPQFLQLAFR